MASVRKLKSAYVKVVGGPYGPCYSGESLGGAIWLCNEIAKLLEQAGIDECMIAAVPEYVEVCTTCQQEFQHDRRGCCPYCGTPLVEERR